MTNKASLNGGIIFLLVVVIVYLVVFFINSDYVVKALRNFSETLLNIFPLLIFVFVIMFLVNYLLTPEMIKNHVGSSSSVRGWLYSLFGGVFIPAPPYVAFPLLGELKEKGMKSSLIVAFLYSRNLQIAFLPVKVHYFGLVFTVVLSFYVLIFSVLSGLAVESLIDKSSQRNPSRAF